MKRNKDKRFTSDKKYSKPVDALKWNQYWLDNRKHILEENVEDSKDFTWPITKFFRSPKEDYDRQSKSLSKVYEFAYGDKRFNEPTEELTGFFGVGNYHHNSEVDPNKKLRYFDNGIDGSYFRGINSIVYNPDIKQEFVRDSKGKIKDIKTTATPVDSEVIVHERSHAQNPQPQIDKIKGYKKRFGGHYRDKDSSLNKYKDILKGKDSLKPKEYMEYLDSPNEIYSRLQQFRFRNNLNPKYKVKEEDIEGWRKVQKKKNIKDSLLDDYNNEFLLNLFNNVAKHNIKTSAVLAKRGLKLKRYG